MKVTDPRVTHKPTPRWSDVRPIAPLLIVVNKARGVAERMAAVDRKLTDLERRR